MEYTTISPNINININNINNSLSSTQSKLISQSKQQISHQQQPQPDFINSINELRDFSTALSAFLHDFDDLRNHITSITSAIDAQLPPHLLLLNTNDAATTTTTEAIFAERNPNGTEKINGELTHANNDDDDELRKVVEESNDKLEGIDVLKKKKESDSLVSEEDIDIWKMIEDIDCDDNVVSKKKKEADIIDKINVLLKKEPVKSDSLSKEDQEIDKSKEEEREIDVAEKKKREESDVLKEDGEIEILEDGEIDMLEDGEIDVSKEEDREIDVLKKKPEEIDKSKEDGEIELEDGEIDMSKETDEIAISKKKRKEIDISKKKPKAIDISKKKKKHGETDISREAGEIRIQKKKHEEIRISKRNREQIKKPKEIDISKKQHEEIDKSKKKHEEIDLSKKKHEEIDKSNETDALKRPAEIDVSKKPETSDTLWKPEAEIDILTKPKERETSKEDGEDDTFTRPAENDASNKLVENDILNKPEEIDVPKEPQEETDASKKPVEIDLLNKPVEVDVSKKPQEETDASKKPVEIDVLNQPEEVDVLNKPGEIDVSKKLDEVDVSNKHEEIDVSNKADEIVASKKPAIAVLESLCKDMCAQKMRKHVQAHISEMNSLHQEIAKALKLAINPAKLVLDSIGKFFIRSKRYRRVSGPKQIAIAERQAAVLILECFVMISVDGIEITQREKKYAENTAIDWRKRMIKEGGLTCMEEVDARGLLLFISGFGIPDGVFSNVDFRDLIRASNVKEISNALRHSTILIPKLIVIDWMVKNNLEIEAADIAYAFGLENKCHKPSEEIDVSNKADEIDASKKPAIAMLELLCKEMRAKEMKKHVLEHISEMSSLHQEIAKALKLAINPAKLVLDSIGRLFLKSKRAYYSRVSGHKQIVARQAAVLILECFVMVSGDGIEITKEDKKYAEKSARRWRKRMMKEGGLRFMAADDARGLLLFISGFRIPHGVFSNKDFMGLIRASNVKEISNALCHSTILIPKLPEVIDRMVKNNLEIEAADIAYTYGLENKCHKLQEETDASKKTVDIDVLNQPEEVDVSKKPDEIDVSKKPDEIDVSNKPEEIGVSNKPEEIDVSNKADDIDASKNPAIAVLEFLCKEMRAKEMKKHVLSHFSEMNSLHQEIAKALKLAINPANLVLDSIGRFFLQASRAYYYGESRHQQIAARQVAVLILECFVMISGDGIEITKEDKEYAENAAIDWRKRMIKDGGLICMAEVDARGLLLFISGFGIPDGVFSNVDFRDLIMASNVKEISNALRHSIILIQKLPEVIDWMVKNNFEIEAADIAYTFGLEDKCHPETILMTFLHNKIKDTQNGSALQVNAATMQQLSDLKSIRKCLETHKIDPSNFLPGVNINEKIEQREKVIELDLKSTEEKSTLKRKEKETEFSKDLNHQQAKRICLSQENLPHKQNPHDNYGIHPYNGSTQPSRSYFDRNLPNNYVTTYSTSSVFSAPVLPPNITNSVPSGLAGSYGPCVYGGPVAEPMAHTNNPWPYSWHGGQPYSRQSQAYDPYPSTAGFYGRPPWQAPAVSFPGLPDHSLPGGFFGRPGSSSDLYRFADTVVERGSHCGPRG